MPGPNITHDHLSTSPVLNSVREEVESNKTEPSAGGNIDPSVTGALEEGNAETDDSLDTAADGADKADKASEALDENEDENASKTDGLDTELSADGSGGGAGGDKGALGGPNDANRLSSGLPSNQSAPQMPPMSPPSSGGSGGGSPMGGGMPPLPQMTQSDLASAPNRDDLIRQLKEMDPKSGGSLGRLSDDEQERRVQELAEKIVNAQPPIPYTWGGGHGAEPGPSGGIRDGGVADSFGDYAKTGVDCSGLARWMTYELYGVDAANGTSESQYASGRPVSASQARPGDLFFPDSAGRPPRHVQVYVGNGQVIEAQKSGTYMMFSPLSSGEFRRMVDD